MQPMSFDPAAVGIASEVIANGTRGLAAGSAASAAVTGLAPAGADEVSAQAAMSFASEGVETLALNSFAQEELMRAGAAYLEIAGMYTAVDGASAATLT
ncbi:PE family protein [Mycobacterium sp. SM1]|uniref:PE family protein n=1 Tax=Mycobacterium sp. SM1 TaxID=2816243 RepID=UPI001BD14317|nr:PE family protein [Mycobacterium sp. SM1]MBS4728056.1 PE family protein [Mycobacterium sp. SM1]